MTTNTHPPTTEDVIEELIRLCEADRAEMAMREIQCKAEQMHLMRRIERLEASWLLRLQWIFVRA